MKLPSIFTFERSINPTIGFFNSISIDGVLTPVIIESQGIRATKSNYEMQKSLDKAGEGNPQRMDVAIIPSDSKGLSVSFSVVFNNSSLSVRATNSEEEKKIVENFIDLAKKNGVYDEISKLYLENIINGTWLWRNLSISDKFDIKLEINSKEYNFSSFGEKDEDSVCEIASLISSALKGESACLKIDVSAVCKIPAGMSVHPSQEFPAESSEVKGKILSSITLVNGDKQAIFHAEKIGNAIRRIDTWWAGSEYALPVEPYGQDQACGVARRGRSDNFYALVEKNIEDYCNKLDRGEVNNEIIYLVACFVRGGLFGGGSKK